MNYKDFIITPNPPYARDYKYGYIHKEYDGPEDSRCGNGRSIKDCIEQIEERFYQPVDIDKKLSEWIIIGLGF